MEKVLVTDKIKSTNVRAQEKVKSLAVKGIQLAFKFSPQTTSKIFTEYLFHPSYMNERAIYKEWTDKAETHFLRVNNSEHHIKTYKWGVGPSVVLVHGWAGRGLQLYSFIEPLIERGYSVITYDAPAHGESTGFATNYFDFYEALQTVIKYYKDIEAIVGHSMGCGSVLANISQYHFISKAILIAPQFDIEEELNDWSDKTIFGKENFKTTLNYLEQKYQLKLSELNPKKIGPELTSNVLLIHDRNDEPCPHHNSVKLNKAIPKSEIYLSEGLGHYRILKNPDIIRKTVDFIDPRKLS